MNFRFGPKINRFSIIKNSFFGKVSPSHADVLATQRLPWFISSRMNLAIVRRNEFLFLARIRGNAGDHKKQL
jgi:hypothetical protein